MTKYTALAISLIGFALFGGCSEEMANIDEIIGTYTGTVPSGTVTLQVNADGSWEYRLERTNGQPEFRREGKWHPDRDFIDKSIVFEDFEFGFRETWWRDPSEPIHWFTFFTKHRDQVWVCFHPDGGPCLSKVWRPSPPKH